MDSERERRVVLAEADAWLRTPYHDKQRRKGCGVDCAQFPAGVYIGCGKVPDFPVGDYPAQFYLHHDDHRYLDQVLRFATELPGPPGAFPVFTREEGPWASGDVAVGLIRSGAYVPRPADFVLFHVGRCWAHGAIVVEWPRIIHAVSGIGVTYGDASRDVLKKMVLIDRKPRFFTLWGREE